MKLINFQGRGILLDDGDYDYIVACIRHGEVLCIVNHRYVGFTRARVGIPLHDIILGKAPTGFVTDHEDRDTYNNQRTNLRHVTQAQNSQNTGFRKNNTSGFKGVNAVASGKFTTELLVNGKRYRQGRFLTARDAAIAYDQLVIQHGSKAPTNASLGLLF